MIILRDPPVCLMVLQVAERRCTEAFIAVRNRLEHTTQTMRIKYIISESNWSNPCLLYTSFSDYGGFLAAEIGPKNNVMPLLAPHFCERFSCEDFLIWDSVHHTGLLHQKSGEYRFFEADRVELPQPDENEQQYRELCKRFYQTIAVEGRENPRQLSLIHI